MEGIIEEKHKLYWDQIIKNDVGSKRFHIPSLIFYMVGFLVLVFNIVTHISNGAYLGAGLTIAIHFVSAFTISWFYKHNEAVIDEDNVTFQRNAKLWSILRLLSQIFALTPLFRICANWKDQKERHETVRMQQKLRRDITEEEINAAVVNKKRSIVKAYFDCIDAFSKAVPQCILQIYIAVDLSLPLRFCTWTDCTRIITIVWSIIVASRATASYTTSLTEYLKALEFQDYVTYAIPISLVPPKQHLWWTTFLTNLFVVGARLFVIAHMLTFDGVFVLFLVVPMFLLYTMMIRLNSKFRPCYENPPSGIVTPCSEIVDRVINIFCFHMIKPGLLTNFIHQFMFALTYSAMKTGMKIFQVQQFHQDLYLWNANYTIENPRTICNFSLFSNSRNKISRIIHHALNDWGDQEPGNASISLITPSFTIFQFKDIFANESICYILICVSFAVSVLYSLYVHFLVRYDHKFPLQTSIKVWKGFLNEKWAETEESLERALSILLLGVYDTTMLDNMSYVLPDGISALKEAIHIYFEENSLTLTADGEAVLKPHLNPCHNNLLKLKNFLKSNKAGEETELLCNYFIKYFYVCMRQMTSYRIAQTTSTMYSRRRCQAACFGNFISWLVYYQK